MNFTKSQENFFFSYGLCLFYIRQVYTPESSCLISQLRYWRHKWFEPRHDKMCLREFPTRSDSNSAIEASVSLEISAIESRDIILSKQWTTKPLIRLRIFSWSGSFVFHYILWGGGGDVNRCGTEGKVDGVDFIGRAPISQETLVYVCFYDKCIEEGSLNY